MSLTIREEKILEAAIAGEQSPIEPVTRREAIFTKATGADIELPPARNKEEDILSKLAVGYAGGGGGGGDFSTAEVTLVNNTNERVASDNYIPMLSEEELTAQPIGASANRSTTSIIVTHKGKAYIEFDTGYNISIEGDAEVTDESLVTVSGDCTLTFNYNPC